MRKPFLLVVACLVLACGRKDDNEALCDTACDSEAEGETCDTACDSSAGATTCASACGDCTEELTPVGLDDATTAGTTRQRLEEAGVDLTGAENPHMGELVWHGGGELGIIDVSPSEGTTTFEAGLLYAGGQAFVDMSSCGGGALYVDLQLTLRTADGALSENWPVRAVAPVDETGVRVRHDVSLSEFSGTFTATSRSAEFPVLATTVFADFPEVGRHDGKIEIAPMAQEVMEPDGGVSGGGAAPAVVARWSTEPGGAATTGGPDPTGCGAYFSDQECIDGGCVWEYANDRCVDPNGTTGGG